MDVDSLDQKTVTIHPQKLTMIQPKDVTLFTITKAVLQNAESTKPEIAVMMSEPKQGSLAGID